MKRWKEEMKESTFTSLSPFFELPLPSYFTKTSTRLVSISSPPSYQNSPFTLSSSSSSSLLLLLSLLFSLSFLSYTIKLIN